MNSLFSTHFYDMKTKEEKEYHTNALYCDEHMEIVSRNEKDDDLVDIFRLPGKD